MVSWKNPDADDRDLGHGGLPPAWRDGRHRCRPGDHRRAQAARRRLLPWRHAAVDRGGRHGAGRGRPPRQPASLLAAQVDFTEAGPLRLFINDSEVTLIEDMMAETGLSVLGPDGRSLRAAARARSDLGARDPQLPAGRARRCLRPDGVERRCHADAGADAFGISAQAVPEQRSGRGTLSRRATRPLPSADIRAPIFAVGTEDDHVAPWQSVYKLHLFADTDVTFVLTSGGHNAGIVSEPGHRGPAFPHRRDHGECRLPRSRSNGWQTHAARTVPGGPPSPAGLTTRSGTAVAAAADGRTFRRLQGACAMRPAPM